VHVKPESAFTFHQNDCSRSARIRSLRLSGEQVKNGSMVFAIKCQYTDAPSSASFWNTIFDRLYNLTFDKNHVGSG
ncbi:hypothetical protein, partial [Rahnella sp. ChDrAdgB13]|uniref:hypothetical protein n=1 Tax=Rahnella sp. ChDrAdgB13 TaxID=1850581 RepID=UPI001AD856C3